VLGVSAVFYAYIGFDAISTTAEECGIPKDAPHDLFAADMHGSLYPHCAGTYRHGTIPELNVNDPLAYVFEKINRP
jgi:hypothetical protein